MSADPTTSSYKVIIIFTFLQIPVAGGERSDAVITEDRTKVSRGIPTCAVFTSRDVYEGGF